MIWEQFARPALFRVGRGDAETAHEWTLDRLERLTRVPQALRVLTQRYATQAPTEVFGVRFPNPVGLAAGMDKNGRALAAWPALGFGFVEAGTVSSVGQPGNPKPRVFRLRESSAVINRMGFNNEGARVLADRLAALPERLPVPLGISLGKAKVTPLDEAVDDYLTSLRLLQPYADYIAVNVSSPNTPGLRELQGREHLAELLGALTKAADGTPVLVKIAPDLTDAAIGEALQVCADTRVAGLIATNTTLARTGLAPADQRSAAEAGGLSGRPLNARAREVVAFVHRQTGGELPVIGVGGIMTPDDAARMFDAGAALIQLYTGFIYGGPALVRAAAAAKR